MKLLLLLPIIAVLTGCPLTKAVYCDPLVKECSRGPDAKAREAPETPEDRGSESNGDYY